MDHQAFAQLLGNYGEFVGAIAVVATLLYFGLQIKRTEQAMINSFQSGMQLARLTGNSQLLDHADLLVNANSGIALDEAQQEKLYLLYRGQEAIMFFAFLSVRNLGHDGGTQARMFAIYLCDNPAMESVWLAECEKERRDAQDFPNAVRDAWLRSVADQLLEVKSSRGNGATEPAE